MKPVVSSIYEYIAATEATTATTATAAIVATVARTATATTVAKAGEPTTTATAVGTDQQEGFSMSSFCACLCAFCVSLPVFFHSGDIRFLVVMCSVVIVVILALIMK